MEKKMIRGFFCLCFSFVFCGALRADEGMWIPILLRQNQEEMQRLGLRLSTEDIYNINASSLKDAVVMFGGGCTGEVVSDQGLLLTNHHCGFGQIQYHSSVEHDYLTKGFWAKNLQEELPCPGLEVRFLREMRDVSETLLQGISSDTPEKTRQDSLSARSKRLCKTFEAENLKADVVPFYYGNQYYLFVYEVFKDVRLVGAPPSNIGKFGGDTDNWMWPRHTGDFSVFRIYADSNNQAAVYSPKNRPYRPKKHLKIDLRGYEEGDFTFVFGYPGKTQEYLSSYGVAQVLTLEDPMRIAARTARLDLIKAAMERDPKVRIQYAAKAASIANGWKKWIGEVKGITRINVLGSKRDYEKVFEEWTKTPAGADFAGILPALKNAYSELEPQLTRAIVFQEYLCAPEAVSFAYSFSKLLRLCKEGGASEEVAKAVTDARKKAEAFFKDYDPEVDRALFEKMTLLAKVGTDIKKQQAVFYRQSIFSDKQKLFAFLDGFKPASCKTIEKDPLFVYASGLYADYAETVLPFLKQGRKKIDSLQRVYMRGQLAMRQNARFYPDANFTLRLTYGKVQGFSPADAVKYKHYTTLDGIMQKENPNIYDYVVEARLKELHATRNYGRYANASGEMPVAFVGTNHTTGGNSGSPVLNADGHLIGLNFDRNWEGTMSDIRYDAKMCRNIMLDIRYCLFIIDKFAGATHLVNEMDIVE